MFKAFHNTSTFIYNKPLNTPFLGGIRLFSKSKVSFKKDSPELPINTIEEHIQAHKQEKFGVVYDKKPFKILLKANKNYSWCVCGQSKNQPFCDGTHKNPFMKIELKPVRFQVAEEKEYYLCNCKQTTHRPFCDGTHKRDDIQEKIKH